MTTRWTFPRGAAVLLGVLAVLGLFAGCAGLADIIRRPEARIASIEIDDIDFSGLTLLVNVEIENPNPVGLRLSAYDYALDVSERRVVEGRRDEGAALAASGVSTIAVPVSLDFAGLADGGAWVVDDALPVALALGLEVDVPVLGTVRLDLSGSADIPVLKPPRLRPREIRVERVTLSGASVLLSIDASNPNRFPLTLRSLEGRLRVSGDDWGAVTTDRAVRVDGGGQSTIGIRTEVDFAAVGRSAWRLLTGASRAEVDLSGRADVDMELPGFSGSGWNWDADADVSILR